MTLIGGIAAVALSACLLFYFKARNGVERPFARNWILLIGAVMLVMSLFIGGAAGIFSSIS
jgi:hypothetical protein